MKKEAQKSRNQLVTALLILSIIILIFVPLVAKVFYWDETFGKFHAVTEADPLFYYPILVIIFGAFSVFYFRDIRKGDEKNYFSIFQFLIIFGVSLYFAISFVLKSIEQF